MSCKQTRAHRKAGDHSKAPGQDSAHRRQAHIAPTLAAAFTRFAASSKPPCSGMPGWRLIRGRAPAPHSAAVNADCALMSARIPSAGSGPDLTSLSDRAYDYIGGAPAGCRPPYATPADARVMPAMSRWSCRGGCRRAPLCGTAKQGAAPSVVVWAGL
jgi:hypothetical protein